MANEKTFGESTEAIRAEMAGSLHVDITKLPTFEQAGAILVEMREIQSPEVRKIAFELVAGEPHKDQAQAASKKVSQYRGEMNRIADPIIKASTLGGEFGALPAYRQFLRIAATPAPTAQGDATVFKTIVDRVKTAYPGRPLQQKPAPKGPEPGGRK